MRTTARLVSASVLALGPAVAHAVPVPVTPGFSDYQASVIRTHDGARLLAFERLDGSASGNLWITRSDDGGDSWSVPQSIIATAANERHPALVELAPSNYVLFYLKGTGATTSFRILRATSSDGATFTEQGALDLGWATGGEINPHVIRHADGALTMSYQRLGAQAGSYLARSSDGGATWDTLRTAIALGSQLPRIAFRESDGLYLASYQVGSNPLSMHVKTSTNPHDWSTPAQDFALDGNNHDSLPVVMPDGAFALFWIVADAGAFDLRVRRSPDGMVWEPARVITATPTENDVQPHPLVGDSAAVVELYWGRASPVGNGNFRIVRDVAVAVMDDILFADGFDGTSRHR